MMRPFPPGAGGDRRMGDPTAARSGANSNKAVAFVKSLYYDEFRWSLVKSVSLFAFGVYLARELRGVDLMPQGQPGAPPVPAP